MIRITDKIALDERELGESFIRSSGPGGQNVNKVSSAVQLRFDARASHALDSGTFRRLVVLAGRRMTKEGVLVITANQHRMQERNREEALARLVELIQQAAIVPKRRKPTRPSRASKQRRLEAKANRSKTKALRGKGFD
jgi:ribosome-associated protein